MPARHPLLAHKRIPLDELLRYPLVLCDPQACEGHAKYVGRVLQRVDIEPLIAERVATYDLMLALVHGIESDTSSEPSYSNPHANRPKNVVYFGQSFQASEKYVILRT